MLRRSMELVKTTQTYHAIETFNPHTPKRTCLDRATGLIVHIVGDEANSLTDSRAEKRFVRGWAARVFAHSL